MNRLIYICLGIIIGMIFFVPSNAQPYVIQSDTLSIVDSCFGRTYSMTFNLPKYSYYIVNEIYDPNKFLDSIYEHEDEYNHAIGVLGVQQNPYALLPLSERFYDVFFRALCPDDFIHIQQVTLIEDSFYMRNLIFSGQNNRIILVKLPYAGRNILDSIMDDVKIQYFTELHNDSIWKLDTIWKTDTIWEKYKINLKNLNVSVP